MEGKRLLHNGFQGDVHHVRHQRVEQGTYRLLGAIPLIPMPVECDSKLPVALQAVHS